MAKNTTKRSNLLKNKSLFFLFFLLMILQTSCSQPQHNLQNHDFPVEVEAIKIKPQDYTYTIAAVGDLQSPQSTEITSELSGKITYLNIPEGKLVNSGHTIAQIENSTYSADIKISEAKSNNARDNFNRMKKLKDSGAISQQALDNVEEKLKTTEGELEKGNSLISKTTIRAPYTGILSLKNTNLGAYIEPGDKIVRISQINPLNLIFAIPEKYLSEIKVGQNVLFNVGNETKKYEAKITAIDPYIDPDTRSANIQAMVDNSNKLLLPGRFAKIEIQTKTTQNSVYIPQEAIVPEEDKKKVYVIENENNKLKVKLTTVKTGEWLEDKVEIKKGLKEGDIVVTSGQQKLKENSKVIIKDFVEIKNPHLNRGLSSLELESN